MVGQELKSFKLIVDDKSAIALYKNLVLHDRSKHIDTKFHYIRECMESSRMEIDHIGTNDQLAYILTKVLGRNRFIELHERLGIRQLVQDT